MRTKHLLYAFALAGAFSACTQDEFEAVNNGEALAGRKLLGDVVLTEAPETRWSVDGLNIKPENSDAMSLMLVDKMNSGLNAQHDYAIDNYTLSEQTWSNFMFQYANNAWAGDAKLVEGNYLFVAPAQSTLERGNIVIQMPAEQNLKVVNGVVDEMSIVKDFVKSGAPAMIGHRFLSLDDADDRAVPQMQHIFAYPKITIQNPNRAGVDATVKKVIIKSNSQKFPVKAALNNVKAARVLTNEVFSAQGGDTKKQVLVGTWAGNMTAYFGSSKNANAYKQASVNADGTLKKLDGTYEVTLLDAYGSASVGKTYQYQKGLKVAKTSDLLNSEIDANSEYIVINVPDVTVKANGTPLTFNAVVPANTYNAGSGADLTLYVVLTNGDIYKKDFTTGTGSVHLYPGKQWPLEDYDAGLNLRDDITKGKFFTMSTEIGYSDSYGTTVKVDNDPTEGAAYVFEADSQDKLKEIIQKNSNANNLTIVVTGDDVVYNQEIENIVGNSGCQKITFQGNINIEGNTADYLLINSAVTFEKATITKGAVNTQKMSPIYYKGNFGELTVMEDATLALYGGYVGTLTNYGTAYLSNYAGYVNNYGNIYIYSNSTSYWNSTRVRNINSGCTNPPTETLSTRIQYEPTVTVCAGGAYRVGDLAYPGQPEIIGYPIKIEPKTSTRAAGKLELGGDIIIGSYEWENWENQYVWRGGLTNGGNIVNGENVDATVVIPRGFNATNEKEGVISTKIEIEQHSTLPCYVDYYMPDAVLYNNGNVDGTILVNGLIVMGTDGCINKDLDAASEGEIDNTERGILRGSKQNVAVYAYVDLGGLKADAIKNLNKYGPDLSNKVSQFKIKTAQTFDETVGDKGKDINLNVTSLWIVDGGAFYVGKDVSVYAGNLSINYASNWTVYMKTDNSVLLFKAWHNTQYIALDTDGYWKYKTGVVNYEYY